MLFITCTLVIVLVTVHIIMHMYHRIYNAKKALLEGTKKFLYSIK